MVSSSELELAQIAEVGRARLPKGFGEYSDYIEASLFRGEWPKPLSVRGESDSVGARLADAVLKELRILLCEDDKRYADVKQGAESFWKLALPSVAGYVAAASGVSVAAATSAAAFIAIAVLRVGLGAFCRLNPRESS